MKIKRKNENKYSTVSLPKPLVDKIKLTINGSGYISVSDFVTDVLRTTLMQKNKINKKRSSKDKKSNSKVFSKQDELRIKQRLKGLGYI